MQEEHTEEGTQEVATDFEKMNDGHIAFCEQYVIDWNGRRAAIAAGYSEVSAHTQAGHLLKRHDVQAYIKHLRQETEKLAGVSMLRNALELAKIAYASPSDLHTDWGSAKKWDELTEAQKAIISEISVTRRRNKKGEVWEETVRFKTHDKQKAIDSLSKLFGYNSPEKLEHSGQINIPPIKWVE